MCGSPARTDLRGGRRATGVPTATVVESDTPLRVWPRFWGITICVAIAAFLDWCALDCALVKFAPERIHDFDWLLILVPLAVAVVVAVHFCGRGACRGVAIAVLPSLAATVAAFVLVLVLGVSFHFAIGGLL